VAALRLCFSLIIVLLLWASFDVFVLSSPRGATMTTGASNIRIEKTAAVGAYDITVLTVHQAAELNGWLTGNGFLPLPAAAEPMVADYARRDGSLRPLS